MSFRGEEGLYDDDDDDVAMVLAVAEWWWWERGEGLRRWWVKVGLIGFVFVFGTWKVVVTELDQVSIIWF